MKAYIGVDLGGTNVRVAKVDENGTILQMVKEATEIEQGVEHVVAKIISMIERIDRYADCEGIGMGVPGPVDTVQGKMVLATMAMFLTAGAMMQIARMCMNQVAG